MFRITLLFAALALLTLSACDAVTGATDLPNAESRSDSAPTLVSSLPSFEALQTRHASEGTTPEGALKLWLMAVMQYGSDNTSEAVRGREGLAFLSIDFKDEAQWWTLPSYQTFVERTWQKPYIFRSYAKGATPDNSYALDYDAFELNVVASKESAGDRGWEVHLESGGADSPRIVYMKKSTSTGLYYASSFDNVYVDIRAPVDPNKETFE